MDRKIRLTNRGLLETGDTRAGSAIIIAVVLTSLLAIVGVMFLMMARVDKIATSAVSENKDLDSAVETVVAKISQELTLDVPGMLKGLDYYDYPDADNAWLASLEPYDSGVYKWRQISDVYGKLVSNIDLASAIVWDYQKPADVSPDQPADADGDGVTDSKWVELDDMTSSKGKPIYAAIRVIDNGGMMNVNTAYKFDPNTNSTEPNKIDGSSQTQVNLAVLSQRGANGSPATAANKLQNWRCGTESNDLSLYEQNVIWRYDSPNGDYIPFDISDELELRNRFLINHGDIDSRIENVWTNAFKHPNLRVPVAPGDDFLNWLYRSQHDVMGPNDIYSYRHIGTTYNMDRIIDPNGNKMININRADAGSIYGAIKSVLDPNIDPDSIAAQITANLIDHTDGPGYPASDPRYDPNNDVTVVHNDSDVPFYGFEQPCIYISELAHQFVDANTSGLPFPGTLDYRSYAVELYKPYLEDDYPDELNKWRLSIPDCPNSPFTVNWKGSQHFHVMTFEHPKVPLTVNFDMSDPNLSPVKDKMMTLRAGQVVFTRGTNISLERKVGSVWISVDSVIAPPGPGGPYHYPNWAVDGNIHSCQRDITPHKCIRRLWDESFSKGDSETLGDLNVYEYVGDSIDIQAHPANRPFTNVGEIGMLLRKSAYAKGTNQISPSDTEDTARLDLTDTYFQKLFKYLTVFDPTTDGIDNDGDSNGIGISVDEDELKVPGRININTAPWYVLAQLPWVSQRPGSTDYSLAQAIVAHRDNPSVEGFRSIGELMQIPEMYYYVDGVDLTGFPDLTTPTGSAGDEALDDFEERDVIFARISNLISVRSDVFTAYILVRIGTDGPQKRVMAILDRSNVYSPTDKVKIIALHPVPDPR